MDSGPLGLSVATAAIRGKRYFHSPRPAIGVWRESINYEVLSLISDMKINSDELAEYVRAVLEGIGKGISEEIIVSGESDTFSLSGPVKFRVGISNSREVGGEVKIFVVGLHGGKSDEQHAQIEFEVSDSSSILLSGVDKIVTVWEKLTKEEKDSIVFAVRQFFQSLALARKQSNAIP